MITIEQAETLAGRTAVGQSGEKIGEVGEVYLDDESGQPEFATVSTGLFGTKSSFVPLAQAQLTGDSLQVPYSADQVKGAPRVETDQALSQQEEAELYAHYGLGYSERRSDSGLPADTGTTSGTTGTTTGTTAAAAGTTSSTTGGTATSGAGHVSPEPPPIDEVRSQEQLRVGTERVETGRARLRKYVVSERQQANVQVAHEEVRVVREPVTDADAAYSGAEIHEAEHEVVLHAERPVVDKEVVPVERVRLDTETVVDEQPVSADVRKEEVELIDQHGRRSDVDSDPTA